MSESARLVARRDTTEESFTAFVLQSHSGLLRTAFLITGDRQLAEDLLQTVLTRLYLRWDRLEAVRGREAMAAYARAALARQAISWWRRAWRGEQPHAVLPEAATAAGTESFARIDDRAVLLTALRQLPVRQRTAVVLRYVDDLSEADTAQAMGCSVGAVKSHTSRALARLRQVMHDPDDPDDAGAPSRPTLSITPTEAGPR